jgi:shikimate kinase
MNETQARHLVLIGYRCSGKSSVGKHLARILGMEWLDTDQAIQEKAGKSIRDIFADQGEPQFRDMESDILSDLNAKCGQMPSSVISSGGGMVMREQNRRLLKKLGPVVWLKVTPETVLARITADTATKDQRPALSDHPLAIEIREMIVERSPFYAATADLTIENDDPNVSSEDLASMILDRLRKSDWYAYLMNQLDS